MRPVYTIIAAPLNFLRIPLYSSFCFFVALGPSTLSSIYTESRSAVARGRWLPRGRGRPDSVDHCVWTPGQSHKILHIAMYSACLHLTWIKVMNAWLWCWIGVIGTLFVWRTSQMPSSSKEEETTMPCHLLSQELSFRLHGHRQCELRYLVIGSWCT